MPGHFGFHAGGTRARWLVQGQEGPMCCMYSGCAEGERGM